MVTDHFDPSRVPEEYVPQPGPFRRDAGGPEEQAGRIGLAGLQQCSDFYGCQQLISAIYFDQDSVAYLPLPNAKVTVTAIDYETDYGDRYVLTDDSFWVWADDNGRVDEFTDPCIDGTHWDQVKISIAPITPQARATSGINYEDWDINSTEVDVWPTVAYYNRDPDGRCVRVNPQLVVSSTAARAVRSVSRAAKGAAAFFGASAPQAELDLKEGTWDFDLPFYDRFRSHIDINDGDVWGSGAQSLAPEFGHFYHDKVIGGLAEVYPFYQGWFLVEVQPGCLVHGFGTYESPSCAYMEGAAHMVAAGALGTDYGTRFTLISSQTLTRDTYGYKNEGAVASYLYHLSTEPSDGVAIGGGALLEALRYCRDRVPPETGGSTSTSWGFINHVASLAYCVEREQHGIWLPIGGDVEYSALSSFPDPYAAFVIGRQYLRDEN